MTKTDISSGEFKGKTQQAIEYLQKDVTEIKRTLEGQNKTLIALIVLTAFALAEKLPQLVSLVLAR